MNSGRARWLTLVALSLGISMIIVDATIVNVAIPSIVRDLGLDGPQAQWIVSVYPLVFAALLITFGRAGDLLGRRRVYLAGLVTFVGASILAGLAPTGTLLILARILQGVGGAAIAPATQSILNTTFRGRDRAMAFAIYGSVIGGMAALGPLVGGWLTTDASWRLAFLVNLPIGIAAFLATLRWVPESRDPHAQRGFDAPGFATLTVGLVAIVFALIEGYTYGWLVPNQPFAVGGWTWPLASVSVIPFAVGLGVASLGVFAVVETRRRRAGRPVLFDVSLWAGPSFRFGNLTATIVALGEFGLLFALPLFLQAVLGYSAFQTGLIFLALAVGSFTSALIAGAISHRTEPRRIVQAGMALEAIGALGTTLLLSPVVAGSALVLPLFVYGLGVGFATAQVANVVLSDVEPERSGLASGANSTLRQVGSAIGAALIGTILLTGLNAGVHDRLATAAGVTPQVAAQVAGAIEASDGQALVVLRGQPALAAAIPAVESAFVSATRSAGFAASAFIGLGLVFSFLLPATTARRREPTEAPDALTSRAGA